MTFEADPAQDAVKYFDERERCAYEKMDFDDIALPAVCNAADLAYCDDAKKAIQNKFFDMCGHIEGVSGMDAEEALDRIDWLAVYNALFSDLVNASYGNTPIVGTWGAYGWQDQQGNNHLGDGGGEFPMYLDEDTLWKDLTREW